MTKTPKILEDAFRHDVIRLLREPSGNVGVELGVAEGIYSERMVRSGAFAIFYGVDMYADYHTVEQYKRALQRVGLDAPYRLLRMTFDEALPLFADESLDFVYVDGYAHGGEEGGDTIYKWACKVKIGGVIAGDDYHPDWPLVVRAVNAFVQDSGLLLHVTGRPENQDYCRYPSWAVIKTHPLNLRAPAALVRLGKRHNRYVQFRNMVLGRLLQALKALLGPKGTQAVKRLLRRS